MSEIPGLVLAERVVTRSPEIVISVGPIQVFSTGFLVAFHLRFAPSYSDSNEEQIQDLQNLMLSRPAEAARPRVTLSVRYADRPTRVLAGQPTMPPADSPLFDLVDGGGNSRQWRLTYWLWPDTRTDVTFLAAWPERGVPAGEVVLTSSDLAYARAAIQQLDWNATE